MSSEGELRRARLGDAAVDAARREAAQAPAPGAALFDALAVLFAVVRPPSRTQTDDAARRDDVA